MGRQREEDRDRRRQTDKTIEGERQRHRDKTIEEQRHRDKNTRDRNRQ